MTSLPLDSNNNPIPALRLKSGGAHKISATDSSARNSTAFSGSTEVISVYSDVDVYIKMGDSSVSASLNDHFFPAGLYYDFAISGAAGAEMTHLAVLRSDSDGTVYISEKI